MKSSTCSFVATSLMTVLPVFALAGDTKDQHPAKPASTKATSESPSAKSDQNVPEVNLLDARDRV